MHSWIRRRNSWSFMQHLSCRDMERAGLFRVPSLPTGDLLASWLGNLLALQRRPLWKRRWSEVGRLLGALPRLPRRHGQPAPRVLALVRLGRRARAADLPRHAPVARCTPAEPAARRPNRRSRGRVRGAGGPELLLARVGRHGRRDALCRRHGRRAAHGARRGPDVRGASVRALHTPAGLSRDPPFDSLS